MIKTSVQYLYTQLLLKIVNHTTYYTTVGSVHMAAKWINVDLICEGRNKSKTIFIKVV